MPAVIVRPPLEVDWVMVPAGEFLMGSRDLREVPFFLRWLCGNEKPQHTIDLPDFRIARVPVTNAQYLRFVDATKYQTPPYWKDGHFPDGKEEHPVVDVSWHDAIAFCDWAGVQLPSEAEWEKAARGTDGRIWPWGNQPPDASRCNFRDSGTGDTTPVDCYPSGASPNGVLDMAGNVWEWTLSLWGTQGDKPDFAYPYRPEDGRENIGAPTSVRRVLRGGSFLFNHYNTRCAYRDGSFPDYGFTDSGFRLLSPGS